MFARALGIFTLAAVVAGCGALPQAGVPAAAVPVAPSARTAKGSSLLYVSDLGANAIVAYTYPAGSYVAKLTGFGSVAGVCANKTGDLFVVDEAGPVVVYAHGGSAPLRKLQAAGSPNGCAVDPTTGDLALTNESSYLHGVVAIYPRAKGKPKLYFDKNDVDATFFCGYDPKGNLFLDGWDRTGNVILLELAKGAKTFQIWKPSRSIDTPAAVQWDGKYVAVMNEGAGTVYRTSAGKVVQTVRLRGGTNVDQFWLQGATLIGPNAQSPGTVSFWHYPAGGAPIKTITGLTYPVAATVSPGT